MKKLLATLILSTAAIVSAQSMKVATTFDAASCFKIDGIETLQVSRDAATDFLILTTRLTFINYTHKILGADNKQDIRIKDLVFKVSLVEDEERKVKATPRVENGVMVIPSAEYKKIEVGRAKFQNDFIIPKTGLTTEIPIAMDQVTKGGNGVELVNPAFDKFMKFFNLLNGTRAQRSKARIVFEGTCKVAVKGENETWIWAPDSHNFEWTLKPYSENNYVLEIIKE